ncbi:MAG: glycosyltransferase family 2 protein [Cryomorphaceae bacterium]|nr:glycosyltransferase family 2 protein [Cryomorphaceae bacterium]
MNPYFSIIIPTFNRAHLISKAIESVIAQTFENWELIIVDDGSTDQTKEIIYAYKKMDSRIQYIYQENAERSAARNNGILQAKGSYVCFLDSDDYFLPDKLHNLKKKIEQVGHKLVVFYDGLLEEVNGQKQKIPFPLQKELSLPDFILSHTLFSQQICAKREVFLKHHYNPKISIGEDMELWLRISEEFTFFPVADSFQTVIVEHDERSINLKKSNSAKEQLSTLRYIFSHSTGLKVNKRIRKKILSNCLFNIARFHMYKEHYISAIIYLLKSIILDFRNEQLKHRLFCLASLFTFSIPQEYQNKPS